MLGSWSESRSHPIGLCSSASSPFPPQEGANPLILDHGVELAEPAVVLALVYAFGKPPAFWRGLPGNICQALVSSTGDQAESPLPVLVAPGWKQSREVLDVSGSPW